MFGIGFGEFTIVLIVLLLAVGPDRMPALMRVLGKGLRQFRSAAQELRSATGIDEIMREENMKELQKLRAMKGKKVGDLVRDELKKPTKFVEEELEKPLQELVQATASTVAAKNLAPRAGGTLTPEELAVEQPSEGVDIAHARARTEAAAGEAEARSAGEPEA